MSYPKHMFRQPGPYGKGERTYRVTSASDEAEEKHLSERGWFVSKERMLAARFGLEEAVEAVEEFEEAIDEISPPTRDELEAKAKELGIGFNRKTKDEVLARRIAEVL